MTTVVDLEVPADRLGIAATFDRVPTFEFRVGGTIGEAPPLVWVSGSDRRTVRQALKADPSVELVADLTDDDEATERGADEHWLVRLEFGSRIKLFQRLVAANDGAIVEASGRAGRWSVQLLFHDRVAVSKCYAAFDQYEFRVEVTRVAGTAELPSARTPLTDTQYETIHKAHELGYFDIPRRVTLEELAAELDVSHQALSERLRRSHAALIGAQLGDDVGPPKVEF